MQYRRSFVIFASILAFASLAVAQTPPVNSPAVPDLNVPKLPDTPSTWTHWGTEFSLMLGAGKFVTGMGQSPKETTRAGDYKLTSWLLSRAGFRSDSSNKALFQ